MTPPKTLKVIGTVYKVKPFGSDESALNDRSGECSKHIGVIKYDKTIDGARLANTLLHESLHALWDEMAMGDAVKEDCEEYVVTALSNGLISVLADNPVFMEWLCTQIIDSSK